MERIATLVDVVRQAVSWYNTPGYKSTAYLLENRDDEHFLVVDVPHYSHPDRTPLVIVMARVLDDMVIIEVDNTDHPLYERLMDAGIPREQIILRYAGEDVKSDTK